MSGRSPSGTFTKPGPTVIGTPVPKQGDRAAFCGCCCSISPAVLTLLLWLMYLLTAILSGISVGAGVQTHMTYYRGQVLVNPNYTITEVKSSDLSLSTGWLRYDNGTAKGQTRDLTELSRGSGAVGYIVAFLLLVSLIVAMWKVVSVAIGGRKALKRGSICLGMLISLVLIAFLIGLYASTSHDLDSYAHTALKIPNTNSIAMAPGFAWFCGFFGGCMWTVIAIFSHGLPIPSSSQFHQF